MADNIRLIDLDRAKRHLRASGISDQEFSVDIQEKVEAASDIILSYLRLDAPPAAWLTAKDATPPGTGVPPRVQAAVDLVLGELYRVREASDVDLLSAGVVALLARDRDPTLA